MGESLYAELAPWWPLVSPPEHYAHEAARYADWLDEACSPATVLELGAGGGHNALHMKRRFEMTLVDRSAAMLRESRRRNPECHHIVGDMRDVRLARRFDAVFIHDAIDHLLTPLDVATTLANVRDLCRPGGAVLLAPDHFRETFRAGVASGGSDAGGQGVRYLEWTHAPEPGASTYRVDYAFALREADGCVRVVHDVHRCGLFSREDWLTACREAGIDASIRRFEPRGPDGHVIEVLLGRVV